MRARAPHYELVRGARPFFCAPDDMDIARGGRFFCGEFDRLAFFAPQRWRRASTASSSYRCFFCYCSARRLKAPKAGSILVALASSRSSLRRSRSSSCLQNISPAGTSRYATSAISLFRAPTRPSSLSWWRFSPTSAAPLSSRSYGSRWSWCQAFRARTFLPS